jgi:catalase
MYKADYPLIEVGEFELNRNPENFFADVEQSAFAPSNLVPGISVSPDKMLQARLFNYADAQRYRLGVNYHQMPVNAARCPVFSNHRDGYGRMDGNYGREPPLRISGNADFWDYREDDADYFTQPRKLFQQMSADQKQALYGNTARALGDAPDFIKQRHIDNCTRCDPEYGAGVAASLGISAPSPAEIAARQIETPKTI